MRKITDFLVNKRNYILVIFIILTGVCFYLSQNVKINRDMAEYLPKTSETRIGMDIMDQEFKAVEESTLNLMFKDLKNSRDVYKYLNSLDDIKDIEQEEKDNYTLFKITVDGKADSLTSRKIYEEIMEKYENENMVASGDIADENKEILPIWIVALAIFCGLIILIIMCDSFVEPFLFLFAILLSVVMNKGTNIIFGTISSITNAIAAILQLALSMDYSIMLMNRYRQEKEKTTDKFLAMKRALYDSFKAISSSSVTTIVGLLALVFMSFTIGRDLGLVLAKGVLFSLVAVFSCLPALILMFDKLIIKTKKKSPNLKLNALGRFAYKMRYVGIALFLLIFTFSYIEKNKLDIRYSDSEFDEVSKVFNVNNQIAILYENKDEKKMSEYCEALEKDDNIDDVLCYSNTINEDLPFDKLNAKLEDLDSDAYIEDYLLKIIYYHYYNNQENNKINLNSLLTFIENDVYDNDSLNKNIDKKMKEDITRLSNFTSKSKITKKHTTKEIAQMFEIKESEVKDLLIYYNSLNNSKKLTLKEFVTFLNNYVLNSSYGKDITKSVKDNINYLIKFLDKDTLNKKMTSKQMAELFALNESDVENLYLLYLQNSKLEKITLKDLTNFIINDLLNDSKYQALFTEEEFANLKMISQFSNQEFINMQVDANTMSTIFNLPLDVVTSVYNYSQAHVLSPYEFVNITTQNEDFCSALGNNLKELNQLSLIMTSALNNTLYSYQDVSEILNIKEEQMQNIYVLYESKNTDLKITPREFINFLLANRDNENLKNIDFNNLKFLKTITDSVINNTKYNAKDMGNLLNIESSKMPLLYSLYEIEKENKKITLSYQEFITFLINDCLTNKEYSKNFNQEKINKIKTLNTIIEDSLNNKKYNKDELIKKLKVLSNTLDSNLIDLIYMDYGSVKEYDKNWTLTVEEFINYLNDDILKDNRFDDYLDQKKREDITKGKDTVNDAKELLKGKNYSRIVLNTKYPVESAETFKFIKNTKDMLKDSKTYIIGNSLVAYDISTTFQKELNLITILTICFIFVVVAITFKSVLIPGILVFLIQTAVFLTMMIMAFEGGTVYFISLLIVQSILMGATIDYAILYTTYYIESRKQMNVKASLINAYNKSINTILTSSLILMLVTLVVGYFSSAITAKICITISQGTLCSTLLILFILPELIAVIDKLIVKKNK